MLQVPLWNWQQRAQLRQKQMCAWQMQNQFCCLPLKLMRLGDSSQQLPLKRQPYRQSRLLLRWRCHWRKLQQQCSHRRSHVHCLELWRQQRKQQCCLSPSHRQQQCCLSPSHSQQQCSLSPSHSQR